MAERKAPLMARRRTIGENPLDMLLSSPSTPAARAGREAPTRRGNARPAPAAAVKQARSVRRSTYPRR